MSQAELTYTKQSSRLHVKKDTRKEESKQRCFKMNWNDMNNSNDRKQTDEDSIKDYTNDEQKKKQFSLIFDFVRQSTKWFRRRRRYM